MEFSLVFLKSDTVSSMLSSTVQFLCWVLMLIFFSQCLNWVFKLSVYVEFLLSLCYCPLSSFFCWAFMWRVYFECWCPLHSSPRHHVVLLTTAKCRLWSCAVHLSMALYLAVPVFSRSNSNTWFTWSMRPLIALEKKIQNLIITLEKKILPLLALEKKKNC